MPFKREEILGKLKGGGERRPRGERKLTTLCMSGFQPSRDPRGVDMPLKTV